MSNEVRDDSRSAAPPSLGSAVARCRIVPRPDARGDAFFAALQPGDLCEGAPLQPSAWTFRCPQCGDCWTMRVPATHRIVQRDPLTVSPSWVCPNGCHYFIRDGAVIGA